MNVLNIEQIQNIIAEATTLHRDHGKMWQQPKRVMPLIAATCMSWHNLDDECIIACKLLMNERMNETNNINLKQPTIATKTSI